MPSRYDASTKANAIRLVREFIRLFLLPAQCTVHPSSAGGLGSGRSAAWRGLGGSPQACARDVGGPRPRRVPRVRRRPLFRKTSCAVSFVPGLPDYNGHVGITELCDICPIRQLERCERNHRQPAARHIEDSLKRRRRARYIFRDGVTRAGPRARGLWPLLPGRLPGRARQSPASVRAWRSGLPDRHARDHENEPARHACRTTCPGRADVAASLPAGSIGRDATTSKLPDPRAHLRVNRAASLRNCRAGEARTAITSRFSITAVAGRLRPVARAPAASGLPTSSPLCRARLLTSARVSIPRESRGHGR